MGRIAVVASVLIFLSEWKQALLGSPRHDTKRFCLEGTN